MGSVGWVAGAGIHEGTATNPSTSEIPTKRLTNCFTVVPSQQCHTNSIANEIPNASPVSLYTKKSDIFAEVVLIPSRYTF